MREVRTGPQAGTLRHELKPNHRTQLLLASFPFIPQAPFSHSPGPPTQGWHLLTEGWDLSCQLAIKTFPHRHTSSFGDVLYGHMIYMILIGLVFYWNDC